MKNKASTAKLDLPCMRLDGTGAIQCIFQGPYNRTRNKPSLARRAFGDAETRNGMIEGMPFLMCTPAERVHEHREEKDTEYTFHWMVEQQKKCTKFKERE